MIIFSCQVVYHVYSWYILCNLTLICTRLLPLHFFLYNWSYTALLDPLNMYSQWKTKKKKKEGKLVSSSQLNFLYWIKTTPCYMSKKWSVLYTTPYLFVLCASESDAIGKEGFNQSTLDSRRVRAAKKERKKKRERQRQRQGRENHFGIYFVQIQYHGHQKTISSKPIRCSAAPS